MSKEISLTTQFLQENWKYLWYRIMNTQEFINKQHIKLVSKIFVSVVNIFTKYWTEYIYLNNLLWSSVRLRFTFRAFKNNRVCTCLFLFLGLRTYSSGNTAVGFFTLYMSINFNKIIGRKNTQGYLRPWMQKNTLKM